MIINKSTARWHYGGQITNKNNVINDIIMDANGIIRCNDHKEYYICQHKRCYCENFEDIPSNVVVIKEYYICQHKRCYCENFEDIPSNVVVIITENIIVHFNSQWDKQLYYQKCQEM